jgi:hypothetical protein
MPGGYATHRPAGDRNPGAHGRHAAAQASFTHMSGLAAAEVCPVDSQLLAASSPSACAPLVHQRRDNAGADAFALAVALAIMRNDTPVGLDGSPQPDGLVKGAMR